MSSEDKDQEDKTEEPTSKRLQEARERGQVAKSREFNSFVMLLVGGAMITFLGPSLAEDLTGLFVGLLSKVHQISVSQASFATLLSDGIITIGGYMMLMLIFFVIAAVLSNMVQHGPIVSLKPLEPQFNRMSLLKNLRQKFSMTNFVEFVKGVFKILAVFMIGGFLLIPVFDLLKDFLHMNPVQFVKEMLFWQVLIFIGVLSFMLVVSVLDIFYQRFNHRKKLRMTKQEIKEEFKNMEGDPQVKARLNKIRMQRARGRMMDSIPDADVVITNPTHYAVVLKYDQETMMSPVMVAKGTDFIAQKIRDIANENRIPIVENPPLARGLFAAMEIDDEIPEEYFQAVAEVITYVWNMNKAA
ncbi:MAG: flagellar biosynthesis protein FlhB [Alphaproteobacteria bacterium]|nr:flagellar biosynthesis protein FlhB [Alphaproteobacteria bacterium]